MYLHDFSPALKYGAKILPSEIAGMLGLPYVGNVYYIDPTNGADTHSGLSQDDAFKTLYAAYNATTNNNHDVIVLTPGGVGTGTGTVETTQILWTKNFVHLIGNVIEGPYAGRARVTTATTSLSPLIVMSGSGNSIQNIQIAATAATNLVPLKITGSRNRFDNCHIGIQNATAGDSASAIDLWLSGASENEFNGCVIGFDSFTKTGANFIIYADTASARNLFNDCIFPMFVDADAPRFLGVAASGIDRTMIFNRCKFLNAIYCGSTNLTDSFTINANPGGGIILHDCMQIGATGWTDQTVDVYVLGFSTNATILTNYSKAVNPAA